MHPLREEDAEFRHLRLHPVGGRQRIGAGRQLQADTRRRHAIVAGDDVIAFAADLDAGDIAQGHLRAVFRALQQDGGELLGRAQQGLGDDGRIQLLARRRRRTAQLPGRNLDVLGLDGTEDIRGRQIEGIQLARVQPDAHGILRAEDLDVADAVDPAERVDQAGADIIGDVGLGQAAVAGDQADDEQEIVGRLGDDDAHLLHRLGQAGGGQGQLVLHLDLGDIRVRARIEGQGDDGEARRRRGRGHIAQIVDPLHLLFDHLGDRILQRLGRGAGIGGGDGDRGRRDGRILRDRQAQDGHGPRHHDDDGDDPGKDRAVDEEIRHDAASITAPWPARWWGPHWRRSHRHRPAPPACPAGSSAGRRR